MWVGINVSKDNHVHIRNEFRTWHGSEVDILPGDTFYILSTTKFQNLTTYQDIELVNPTLVPTNLSIGADVVVPVSCQCPQKSLTSRGVSHLLTYQLRPSDTNASVVASSFRADLRTVVSINERKLVPFSTVLIPVTRIPTVPATNNSGSSSPTASGGGSGKDGVVVGLSIGLCVVGMGFIDGQAIAVKKMKWNAYQELRILQKVNHTNQVKLEGFYIDPDRATLKYVENGSLSSWLHQELSKTSSNLDWKTRLHIAGDVANGLQYIHEHTWPKAKITIFGLARSGCNAITTYIVGTHWYIAPEYLADGLVTTKMDVFAYGVVLLELVSGREVMGEKGEMLWAEAERVESEEEVKAWMDKKLVEGECCPMERVMSVFGVARACMQRDPTRRPSMVDVVYTLSRADDACSDFSGDGLVGHGSGVFAR
ncbi:Protein LYK5 [Acorus gramineus]|uniref:Protein LYK5 n=1 Tax=Acorus gramineus TaxID=55184 RepID=A0AAV9BBW7_ACOGR|nr:Protein LYK5 [Acorus gramineus]